MSSAEKSPKMPSKSDAHPSTETPRRKYEEKLEFVTIHPQRLQILDGSHDSTKIENKRTHAVYFEVINPPGCECQPNSGWLNPGSRMDVTFRCYDVAALLKSKQLPVIRVYFQQKRDFPTFWTCLTFEENGKDDPDPALHRMDGYEDSAEILNEIIKKDKTYLHEVERRDPSLHKKIKYTLDWTKDERGYNRAIAACYHQNSPQEEREYYKKLEARRAEEAKIARILVADDEIQNAMQEHMLAWHNRFEKSGIFEKKGEKKAGMHSELV